MKNLLRKLHIGGNHDDQVDAGRIIEGRSYEGSGSNAASRGSSAATASATLTTTSQSSATTVFTPTEQKEIKTSGLATFLNAVGSAVGRVGQAASSSNNSNNSINNQISAGGQPKLWLETAGGSGPDTDLQTSKGTNNDNKELTPSLGGGDGSQIDIQSLQVLQSEEEYQVQIAMALSVSNSYMSNNVVDEAEKVQIEVAKRISLGLSPSSGKSQADIVSYRYWACNMVDYDEIIPDGFYDVSGVLSESYLSERMPSLSKLTRLSISESSKIEAVLVDRSLDPDLVSLEERVVSLSISPELGLKGSLKTELAQKIALIVVEHMGGPVGSDTEMLDRWRKASWDIKKNAQNVVLTLGGLTIGLTRHRALLFKVLADRVGLRCQLVKGGHYQGFEEEGAVNIVKVEDDREYMIDLMGAPGALIPPDKPQANQTGNAVDMTSSTDVSPRSAKAEHLYSSVGGSSCDSPSGSMHSTRSTPEVTDVPKDRELHHKRTGEQAESKALNLKLEGRHHSEPGELAGLSVRPRLHARSPSWTEGMLEKRQTGGARPLKDVFLGVAKEHPQLAQKLHDVLLESGVSPPPDLLAEISPKQLQASVLEENRVADEKNADEGKGASEAQSSLHAVLVKKKGSSTRGRPPTGAQRQTNSLQQVADEGSNSKDRLLRLDSVEGLGERRPLGGVVSPLGGLTPQSNIVATPGIVPLVVIPPVAQETFLQPGMMPVAAAAAATAAVVASTMVAAAARIDGDTNLEVPMAAAATATAAVVAATSAVAGRRLGSNESSPHGSNEKDKGGSGRRRSQSEETEKVGSGGERGRLSGGEKRFDDTDASSPGTSDGRGRTDARTNSNFGDGLDGEVSIEEERNSEGLSGSQQRRIDAVLRDVAEWEIPWEDIIIGERIGLGSYGEVYRGDWHGSEVAVKKFVDQDLSGDALEEFRLEVRIMRRLRHPNVVLFMGAVTRPPNLSIVTEFLPRGSLYRLIHRPNNQLDERRRLRMAFDVAKGMNYLHSSTPIVVHRDLKSPNLLVDKNWVVKVCDFGLSRLKHNTFLSSKSTAGTPEWMAPEMLRNEPSNEKCDVYSFGVILWELATLRQPWGGMNPMQVVGAVGFQHRRLDIPTDMDPQLANIIRECWQNDPNARPSFSQLMAALKPLQRPLAAQQQESQKQGQSQRTIIQSPQPSARQGQPDAQQLRSS
ncbi:hypothetical protein R1flu_027430 [Riccia fluitans]|uniref:non-specific serine/threonine protein kinase n=1 Tax=Riccia fluitans TaxID=41844 RepID=A0ABD1XIS0_9MARC